MRSIHARVVLLLFIICVFATPPATVRALEPDQILMIVNKNVDTGRRLAEFYAQKRQLPDHRICELDLPAGEDISFDDYERKVVPPVREFLRHNALEHKITCLLTFYGVPIRIGNRVNTPLEQEELADLKVQLRQVREHVAELTGAMERLAETVGPGGPASRPVEALGNLSLAALAARADAAMRHIAQAKRRMDDPRQKQDLDDKMKPITDALSGPLTRAEQESALGGKAPQPGSDQAKAQEQLLQFRAQFAELQDHRFDAESRHQLRDLVAQNLGPFDLGRLLETQINYMATEHTEAAFDNELALLWWGDYPRSNWLGNPLFYGNHGPLPATVMMVMRLDGPQTGTARDIIEASLKAEHEGLQGQVCIDSRGIPAVTPDGKLDPYGQYDQTLRNLSDLIHTKTKLSQTFDDLPEVLPANSVNDVAIYVGWYSLNKYVPACRFNVGAVGYHIASATMVSLHKEKPGLWVAGLLNDGVVATLGPCDEPYLQSFPRADDFFPLLFTGKLTLAEVYWKTTPLTSWMISMIGDPLYTPYKTNPALAVEDLPPRLKVVFAPPATRPAPQAVR